MLNLPIIKYLFGGTIGGVLTLIGWIYMKPSLIISIWKHWSIFTSPFHSKCVQLYDDIHCSYIERGDAKKCASTILFLHGYSGSKVDFIKVASYLDASKYHLLGIDMLNHGDSSCIDRPVRLNDLISFIRKFIKRLSLSEQRIHIVGFSMGGVLAAHYASLYSNNIASLVLLAPASIKYLIDHPLFHIGGDGYYFIMTSNEQMLELLNIFTNGKPPHIPSFFMTALRYHKNESAKIKSQVLRGMQNDAEITSPDLLMKIKDIKCLILWGENDEITNCEAGRVMETHLSNASVHYLKDAGHIILLTHEKETMRYITQHFDQFRT